MRLGAPNMSNPFAQQTPVSKPLYSPAPKPTTTTFGGVTVNTTKPVVIAKTPVELDASTNTNAKTGFVWASKTKKQKTIIIAGSLTAVFLLYLAFKKK